MSEESGEDVGKNGKRSSGSPVSSLTITKLRRELTSFGVPLPPSNSKKEVYLQLYDKHVLTRTQGGEFSSDDDMATGNGNGERMPVSSLDVFFLARAEIVDSVERMLDAELYEALTKRGEKIGPVVDSTRNMYRKKLKDILVQDLKKNGPPVDTSTEESDSEDELNVSKSQRNGSSASASASTRSGSSPPAGSSTANTSRSLANGFSSGESDIDNICTLEDYARATPPKHRKVPRTPTYEEIFGTAAKYPTVEREIKFNLPSRTPPKSGANRSINFNLEAGPSRRVTENFSSGFENAYARTSTATVSDRQRRTTTTTAARDWGSTEYGVGLVRDNETILKPRRGNPVIVDEDVGKISYNWILFCGFFFFLALGFIGYFLYMIKDISADDAIDQQIEETLKFLSNPNGEALN